MRSFSNIKKRRAYMTDFLVNNPNITILYFFISIFIMGASAISIFFMYKTIKHNKKRDSDETFLLTITTGLFFLFSALSYVHFQELMDQYAVTNQKVEQYYIIEKVGNNLLFTEKESHPALKDTFSSEIASETDTEYVLLVRHKKVFIPKSDVTQ